MTGCCVPGCKNSSAKGFSLRRFPQDPDRRALWTFNVNRSNWEPSAYSHICEVHFADVMWEKMSEGKRKLKCEAIPTLFMASNSEVMQDASSISHPNGRFIILDVKTLEKTPPAQTDSVATNGYDSTIGAMVVAEEVVLEAEQNVDPPFSGKNNIHGDHDYTSLTGQKSSPQPAPKITYHSINWREEYAKLRKRVEERDKAYTCLRRKSEQYKELMKQRMKTFTVENRSYKKLLKMLREVFTPDQIEVLEGKSPRGARWSTETVERAFRLRNACGSRGYQEILNQQFPYPSERTIKRKIKNNNLDEQPTLIEEPTNDTNFNSKKENLS